MQASLASGQVDVCLIPEVPFQLEGEHGLVAYLEHLLETRGHVVICIAEGTAQVRCTAKSLSHAVCSGAAAAAAAAASCGPTVGWQLGEASTYTHTCCAWASSGKHWPCLPYRLCDKIHTWG